MTTDLINYLESVQDLYPFGVPKRLISASGDGVGVHSQGKVLILGDELTPKGQSLLHDSLVKGLKLGSSDFVAVVTKDLTVENLKLTLSEQEYRIVICYCGAKELAEQAVFSNMSVGEGEMFNLYGHKALRVTSPDQVIANPALKRRYWEQLQKVLVNLDS